jgi:hypothetical protein
MGEIEAAEHKTAKLADMPAPATENAKVSACCADTHSNKAAKLPVDEPFGRYMLRMGPNDGCVLYLPETSPDVIIKTRFRDMSNSCHSQMTYF